MRNKDELPDILTAQQIATYLGISRKKSVWIASIKGWRNTSLDGLKSRCESKSIYII